MFIDNKGRLFGKVSIIDILIVLLIVGAAGVSVYKLKSLNPKTFIANDVEIQVQVQSKNATDATFDAIEVGSVFREEKSKQVFGTVVKKDKVPTEQYGQASDGSYVKSTFPGRYDITLTLKCTAKPSDTGYTVGGQDLKVTGQYVLKDPKVQQTFYVISIKD